MGLVGRVAWFAWTVVCWSFGSGGPLYVVGGWRWGLPVANHPVSGLMSAARFEC